MSLFKSAASKLDSYQTAYRIVLAVYRASETFPDTERYGLVSQMQRASVSIAANIAEGAGRTSKPQFRQFVMISLGSLSELRLHLKLGHDLGYLDQDQAIELNQLCDRAGRQLWGLLKYLGTD